MELITQYSRAYRRAYERSISEQKYENHPHFAHEILKGQNFENLRKKNLSYQQENAMRYEDCDDYDRAKDLRIEKNTNGHSLQISSSISLNSRNDLAIKQEILHPIPSSSPPPPTTTPLIRRYFCIFCKLDYLSADDFLEHLELHPNGSFVLVKREMSPRTMPINHHHHPPPPINSLSSSSLPSPPKPSIQRPPSPKILINHQHHYQNCSNNDVDNHLRTTAAATAIMNGKYENFKEPSVHENDEEEEEVSNLPIIPEVLKNQIKIEPISEDDDDDDDEEDEKRHIRSSTFNHQRHDAPQYNNNNNNINSINNNHNEIDNEVINGSPTNNAEGGDPNQQLLVLSNPRIGDGPGEYLCNVCQAKFVYKNNLKSHLKRHLGIYPYVCFCGKRYQFKCKLNKHIEQAHAKIKNFKCPVPTCPKKYFTRNDLAFHISVTHQERQEIPCNICQKVFNSQKSLQIHCRKYHRNQES